MARGETGKDIVLKGIDAIYSWSADVEALPLESIFARLSLSSEGRTEPNRYLAPAVLSDQINYPRGSLESDASQTQKWRREVEQLRNRYSSSDLSQMSTDLLLFILEKYGCFIPASAYPGASISPDVSLYDYVRINSAIAACREHCDSDVLLVSGDFSGLQRFIYTTSSKGALKTLRARSFFLELLNEHVIYEIIGDTLSRANIIYSGGGGFCILAPATDEMEARLRKARSDINSWLLEQHGTRLYLGMEWMEIPTERLFADEVADNLEELHFRVDRSKQVKFLDQLKDGSLFAIKPPQQPTNESSCQICRRDDLPESIMERLPSDEDPGERACALCYRLFKIGERLPNVRYIARGRTDCGKNRSIPIGESAFYSIFGDSQTDQEGQDMLEEGYEALWIVNSFELEEYIRRDAKPMYIANQATRHGDLPPPAKDAEDKDRRSNRLPVPKDQEMASFEGLASAACGADLIGVLRADVDNLRAVVTRSLRQSPDYLMRLSALSSSLNHFFKLHLNRICLGQDLEPTCIIPGELERYVAIVYAGGDDLFIVGAWNNVAELAFDVDSAFRRYTCHNPDITLSAGVTIHPPKSPIYQMARLSGRAEEAAKENVYFCTECHHKASECELRTREGQCNRKDSIALFYDPLLEGQAEQLREELQADNEPYKDRIRFALKWQEVRDNVLKTAQLLAEARKLDGQQDESRRLRLEYLPRGFLQKMSEMVGIWRREGKLYLPHMAWMTARLREDLRRVGKQDLAQKLMLQLYRFDQLGISSLHAPVAWIDLLMRGGGRDE